MHAGTILLICVLFISLSLSLFSPLKKVMLWELDLMYNAGLDVNWGAKSVAELGVSPPILSYLLFCSCDVHLACAIKRLSCALLLHALCVCVFVT
jgi:hypothetical protein